jgi:hypothetical protein
VLAANWQWGAPAPTGILTDVTTGRAEITFADPNRTLDPLNDASPYITRIGNPGRILIDGSPAFTGVITNVSHEASDATSILELADHLSLLHQQAVSVAWVKTSTADQFTALLDLIEWPADLRIQYGATTTKRLAEEFVGTAFEAASRLRDAELGAFWADHQGRPAFRSRGFPRPTIEVLTLGCDGVAMASLSGELRRIAIINHVLIDFDPGTDRNYLDSASIALHQRRSYQNREADLLFDNL